MGLNSSEALIVGGSGGIGSLLAKKMCVSGWNLSILSRNRVNIGGITHFFKADLTSADQIQKCLEEIKKAKPTLKALIFAAGAVSDSLIPRLSEDSWERVVSVNLKSVWQISKELVPLIEAAGGGHIVCLGSIVGVTGRSGQSNYAAAKAGLTGLCKSLAREAGEKNIRVNVILPGFLQTKMTSSLKEDQIKTISEENVLKRTGTVEEVVRFIQFLISTEHISGQVFNLDSRILSGF